MRTLRISFGLRIFYMLLICAFISFSYFFISSDTNAIIYRLILSILSFVAALYFLFNLIKGISTEYVVTLDRITELFNSKVKKEIHTSEVTGLYFQEVAGIKYFNLFANKLQLKIPLSGNQLKAVIRSYVDHNYPIIEARLCAEINGRGIELQDKNNVNVLYFDESGIIVRKTNQIIPWEKVTSFRFATTNGFRVYFIKADQEFGFSDLLIKGNIGLIKFISNQIEKNRITTSST